MVARPNCTSKLTGMDDLRQLGGSSLGFRGQALASAAEMSGSLTISTRVESEDVATAMRINQEGEVVSKDRSSLTVGSTVKITDFIKAHPVRKQVALKNTERCLKKIKQTLQAYAFARPSVRLSLRILKAKNDKGNWMYAPKPGGNAEDAAFKIVGAACASQCIWSVIEERGFTLQAFLPRPEADVAKVSNVGAFISVDGRPVAATRGTFKQVIKIFRGALSDASTAFAGVKDPFIYLALECPLASYDPNVEPAKDEVLFEDADTIVDVARKVFAAVYPHKQAPSTAAMEPAESVDTARRVGDYSEDEFTTSLEAAAASTGSLNVQEHFMPGLLFRPEDNAHESDAELPALPKRAFRSNMYGCDEEDLEFLDARPPTGRTEADFEELRQARKDVNVSNPWVIAKMNTSLRLPAVSQGTEDISGEAERTTLSDLEPTGLPTPRPSSPLRQAERFHPSDHVPDVRFARDGRLIGSQSLLPPGIHLPPSPHRGRGDEAVGSRDAPMYDYTLPTPSQTTPAGTPVHAIPTVDTVSRRSPRKQRQQEQINRPYVSPVKDQPPREKVWFDHLEDEGRRPAQDKRPWRPQDSSGLVAQGELGDLMDESRPLTPPRRNRDIREFVAPVELDSIDTVESLIEQRNYSHVAQSRKADAENEEPGMASESAAPLGDGTSLQGFVPASELIALEARLGPAMKDISRPTKRQRTSEACALREISGNGAEQPEDDEYQPKAPDRTTSRRRRTTDGSRVHRTKSSQLPLERIPAGQGTHQINLSCATTIRDVARAASNVGEVDSLLGWNEPALEPYNAFAAAFDDGEVRSITSRLSELLISQVWDGELAQDLYSLVRDALASHSAEDTSQIDMSSA